MIDFAKTICTPAKVYFVLTLLIAAFSLCSGRFLQHVIKDKNVKKSKKMLKKLKQIVSFAFIFSLIFVTLITLLFNYFCSLGYVNIVGGVVFVLLLWRFYVLFKDGY